MIRHIVLVALTLVFSTCCFAAASWWGGVLVGCFVLGYRTVAGR